MRVPVIKPSNSNKPHTFNIGANLDKATIAQFKAKGWLPFDWTADREIVIESTHEIAKIMQQKPVDRRGE